MKLLIKILLPIIIIGAGIFLFTQLKASRPEPVALQAPEKQWVVKAAEVTPGRFTPLVKLYGRIESPVMSTLTAAVAANVDRVMVREGDFVTPGGLLVELDDTDLKFMLVQRDAEIAELKASLDSENNRYRADTAALKDEQALLDLAQRNLGRARQLASTRAGSEAAVDDALEIIRNRSLAVVKRQLDIDDHPARLARLQASLDRAGAARSMVERDLQRSRIEAPFTGRITSVEVAEGERVRVGDDLVNLYDDSRLEVRAQVPDRHVAEVRSSLADGGLKAVMQFDNSRLDLELVRLSAAVRSGQGGLDAFFRIVDGANGNAGIPLEVGRVARVELQLPLIDNAISLPLAALYGSDTVYRIEEGRLLTTPVRYIGEHRTADGELNALIKSDSLSPGDTVVTSQIPAAVDGLKVEVSAR
ncbi:MAG: hypothetical protein DHS20C01_20800 [marine bacterium B5-7]|nr:MAG: hypothetical protein DHS20C01_20800 [marine bacterium B5-7]